ncbi:MAG: putative membrane-bound metal-dependent hydrolase (DUF457) [halophilic archaeon J07HX5]|nr:MAG: putative membrane-bound metal-dependent hydrolase (DUF457) [halophilic archaeon J07HX5]
MFLGHGLAAFALAASLAAYCGWGDDRALAVGLVAGLFATLPDVDVVYTAGGFLTAQITGPDSFWGVANELHRGITHSLVVGAAATLGFAGWRARTTAWRGLAATLVLTGLVGLGLTAGPAVGAVMLVFVVVGVGIVRVAELLLLGPRVVLATAGLGLGTHPFGDLLTGSAPAVLYPFEPLSLSRIALHPDPTIHLLGSFAVELAVVWAALVVGVAVGTETQLRDHVQPRAALGISYAAAAVVVPAPTLDLALPFVASVLSVGIIAAPVRAERPRLLTLFGTALTAVTLAAAAYAVVYLAGAA